MHVRVVKTWRAAPPSTTERVETLMEWGRGEGWVTLSAVSGVMYPRTGRWVRFPARRPHSWPGPPSIYWSHGAPALSHAPLRDTLALRRRAGGGPHAPVGHDPEHRAAAAQWECRMGSRRGERRAGVGGGARRFALTPDASGARGPRAGADALGHRSAPIPVPRHAGRAGRARHGGRRAGPPGGRGLARGRASRPPTQPTTRRAGGMDRPDRARPAAPGWPAPPRRTGVRCPAVAHATDGRRSRGRPGPGPGGGAAARVPGDGATGRPRAEESVDPDPPRHRAPRA